MHSINFFVLYKESTLTAVDICILDLLDNIQLSYINSNIYIYHYFFLYCDFQYLSMILDN